MKLYCSPGASSLAARIAFHEAGMRCEFVDAGLHGGMTGDGRDFGSLNPIGTTPLLAFDDGMTLRGAPPILHFVAHAAPSAALAPPTGSFAALRMTEWMHFAMVDWPEGPTIPSPRGMAWLDVQLATGRYLVSSGYSIADILLWPMIEASRRDVPKGSSDARLAPYANVARWHGEVATRPAIRAALADEPRLYAVAAKRTHAG